MSDETSIATGESRPFDREDWPFYWVSRVLGRYHELFEGRLKRMGLDISRWRVLMCLVEDAGMSISDLAEEALVKVPTMMKLAQRMEQEGLVTLENRPSDGRVTDVVLTAKGCTLRDQALDQAMRIYDNGFKGMDAAERQELIRNLKTLWEALDR